MWNSTEGRLAFVDRAPFAVPCPQALRSSQARSSEARLQSSWRLVVRKHAGAGRRRRGVLLLLDDHLLEDLDQDLLPDFSQTITADAARA